jgi:hypothetical protein
MDNNSSGVPSSKFRPKFRSASEQFRLNGKSLPYDVGTFWRWAFSDLNSNTARGLVAEFIVAQALGCADVCREEWYPCDLVMKSGMRIEVKSAAYRQTWAQRETSPIRFGIGPARAWNPETGKFADTFERQSDVYIFCVLENQTPSPNDPLDLDRWSFYLLSTAELNRKCPAQRSISLAKVISLGARRKPFAELKDVFSNISIYYSAVHQRTTTLSGSVLT